TVLEPGELLFELRDLAAAVLLLQLEDLAQAQPQRGDTLVARRPFGELVDLTGEPDRLGLALALHDEALEEVAVFALDVAQVAADLDERQLLRHVRGLGGLLAEAE